MDENLYRKHLVRCIITSASGSGKSVTTTNSILYIINENNKIYIYSQSLHQALYQKLFKCFSSFVPNHMIQNILYEEDIDILFD